MSSIAGGSPLTDPNRLSTDLLGAHRRPGGGLATCAKDATLRSVASDLGDRLVRLARDRQLRDLTTRDPKGWPGRSLQGQLG